MSVTATRAPSAASRRQVAAPMPEAPPVTRAVRSARRKACASLPIGWLGVPVRIGYKASAEQFDPVALLDFAVEAERSGLAIVAGSDHLPPWRHTAGPPPPAPS